MTEEERLSVHTLYSQHINITQMVVELQRQVVSKSTHNPSLALYVGATPADRNQRKIGSALIKPADREVCLRHKQEPIDPLTGRPLRFGCSLAAHPTQTNTRC